MAHARYASLLDDPTFLAELDQVEVRGPAAVERPTDRWFVEPPPAPSLGGRVSIVGMLIGVAGFFMMMGLGCALAVYVYADRVAMLLHH